MQKSRMKPRGAGALQTDNGLTSSTKSLSEVQTSCLLPGCSPSCLQHLPALFQPQSPNHLVPAPL